MDDATDRKRVMDAFDAFPDWLRSLVHEHGFVRTTAVYYSHPVRSRQRVERALDEIRRQRQVDNEVAGRLGGPG